MKKLSLCLHSGGHRVERDEIDHAAVPLSTRTFKPIPHQTLVGLVEDQLPKIGLDIVHQEHALMKDGGRYFGLFQVAPSDITVGDYSLVIGVRNAHDKSFPAGLCVGSGVFICDNLAFSSEIVVGRRHTRWIMRDLPGLVAGAVGKLVQARVNQDNRLNAYKLAGLTDERAAKAIFEAIEHQAINRTDADKVWNEWRKPSHSEFAADQNVWRFLNAVTEVAKGTNPFTLQSRTQRLHPLLDSLSGLTVGTDGDIIDVEHRIVSDN